MVANQRISMYIYGTYFNVCIWDDVQNGDLGVRVGAYSTFPGQVAVVGAAAIANFPLGY